MVEGEMEVLDLGFGLYAAPKLVGNVRVLIDLCFLEDPLEVEGMAA